ncbi:MAG: DNA polymerase III subunit gamma/tau [Roseibacillus sp.]|nr:DNA polymerase III subunit gamma/tau [Roseibacillus sp.]
MSYQVFARKYRPRTFDDVLGQDHVVTTLRNAIEGDRLAHAYLFVGPRGTGKTSIARILAKALNCSNGPRLDFDPDEQICLEIAEGRSLDVLEIDGATSRGIDEVRELRETVSYAPASGHFRIYYIDEVHMLTSPAFNALLKTLEEPPPHVKFIFATTEPNKILPTIISRCQRFDLRPLPTAVIADHLQHIASEENVTLEESAAWSIARGAEGGMRDAQSMLDQLVAFCGETITEKNVQDVFGFTSSETVAALTSSIFRRNTAESISLVETEASKGKDLTQLLSELAGFLRALLIDRLSPESASAEVPPDFWEQLGDHGKQLGDDRLLAVLDRLADADARMRRASNKQLHFEIALIRATQSLDEVRISDVVRALEKDTPQLSSPDTPREATNTIPASGDRSGTPEPPTEPASTRRTSSRARKKRPDVENQLESLIEQAPEKRSEDPPPDARETTPGITESNSIPSQEESSSDSAESTPQDSFYDDPLVHDALRIFKGKLKE